MKWFTPFRVCVLCLLILVMAAYSNHFTNSFHFDDEHTILNNTYIHKLSNIPQFFKSAATFSILPMNQTYRPLLTTLYAVAYQFNGVDNAIAFHIIVFAFYLLLGLMLYLFIAKLFSLALPGNNLNPYFSLFATGWYMLNVANADTINYLSSASDSVSTFWVVAAMVLYMYKPQWRKYFLYLIPVTVGVFFKQSALAFAGLLAAYFFLFESGQGTFFHKVKSTVIASLPSLVVCALLYGLQSKLTSSTYITGGKPLNYIITQPYVMLRYFTNFVFPVGLTADTDLGPFASISDYRFWIGIVFLALLIYAVIKLFTHPQYRLVAFGVLWFVISLLPSSLVPLSEVMNDYRPFFAYIGEAIMAGWLASYVWRKWIEPNSQYKRLFAAVLVVILLGNAIGTYARNRVWATEETLWYDTAQKSPMNGRALMNYGLTQMNKGNYPVAEEYFLRGLKFLPQYSYLYANMGVLKSAEKQYAEAENYFKNAVNFGQGIPVIYYFYARFLHEQGRDQEALSYVKQAIQMSPAEAYSRYLAMEIYQSLEDFPDMAAMAQETLKYVPGDTYAKAMLSAAATAKTKLQLAIDDAHQHPTPENYLTLSLLYFNKKDYPHTIEACKEAIKLNPKYALAYNNMGSAYNNLGEWKNAQDALKEALKIQPDFQLAQNNYNFAAKQQALTDSMNVVIKHHPTAENYIALSLIYYGQGLYLKAIDACKEAIKINPSYSVAYNNMCAAYNNLQMWDDAIAAGEKALQIDPNSQLAKNNYAAAKQGKANSGKQD